MKSAKFRKLTVLLLLNAVFFTDFSSAGNPRSVPPLNVQPLEPGMDLSDIQGKGINLLPYRSGKIRASQSLPDISVRDSAFKSAELSQDVRTLDQLDKDQLYQYARTKQFRKLLTLFPSISQVKLEKLNAVILKNEGNKRDSQ